MQTSLLGAIEMVGEPGFEPGTSSSRTKRATKLRYSPMLISIIR